LYDCARCGRLVGTLREDDLCIFCWIKKDRQKDGPVFPVSDDETPVDPDD